MYFSKFKTELETYPGHLDPAYLTSEYRPIHLGIYSTQMYMFLSKFFRFIRTYSAYPTLAYLFDAIDICHSPTNEIILYMHNDYQIGKMYDRLIVGDSNKVKKYIATQIKKYIVNIYNHYHKTNSQRAAINEKDFYNTIWRRDNDDKNDAIISNKPIFSNEHRSNISQNSNNLEMTIKMIYCIYDIFNGISRKKLEKYYGNDYVANMYGEMNDPISTECIQLNMFELIDITKEFNRHVHALYLKYSDYMHNLKSIFEIENGKEKSEAEEEFEEEFIKLQMAFFKTRDEILKKIESMRKS